MTYLVLYIRVSNQFKVLSEKYHKMSLLFYELSQSMKLEGMKRTEKEFKQYLKSIKLDVEKIKGISQDMKNLELNDLRKDRCE